MIYRAIIGDIIKSREINERETFQKKLNSVLEEVNEKFMDIIASKFTVTLGDEFQGLLLNKGDIFTVLFYIKLRLFPVKVRIAMGIGEITTEIDPDRSLGADGPAYHRARDIMDEFKDLEKKPSIPNSSILIKGTKDNYDNSLNTILTLMTYIEKSWSLKQVENIFLTFFKEMNQKDIAYEKGINQSTVSRSLDSAGYYEYILGVFEANRQLNEGSSS